MAQTRALTYRDYAALPDDGRRYELHDGELSVTPAPGVRHQDACGRLYAALLAHVDAHGGGRVLIAPVDVILSDTTVVQPDIVYVARDRLERLVERGVEGTPTLAIEALSPSSIRIDRERKMQLYAWHGLPYYWIVDPPGRTIEAYALASGRYDLRARVADDERLRADPFPELVIQTASLWV
jgi:Uma2 family endonuclease